MTDFVFLRGGPCIPECLPICEGCRESTWNRHAHPLPTQVAGEYNRGHFTLGWTFNPLTIGYQRLAIECQAMAVGDFIAMYGVPELHTLLDVKVAIKPNQTVYGSSAQPNRMTYLNNMVGLQLGLTIQLRDSDGVLYVPPAVNPPADMEVPDVPAGFAAISSPPKPAVATDEQAELHLRGAISPETGGFFVPKGYTAVVGLTVLALPTANPFGTGPFPMELMSGSVELCSHVVNYEVPING